MTEPELDRDKFYDTAAKNLALDAMIQTAAKQGLTLFEMCLRDMAVMRATIAARDAEIARLNAEYDELERNFESR